MESIDELKAAIEKLETSADDIESSAREMFRSAQLIDTSNADPTPFPSCNWIKPNNDAWKKLQRDVIKRYQDWYSTTLQYVKVHIPDRLEEFKQFYGDQSVSGYYGIIEALHLNICESDNNSMEKVDRYMDMFMRQRSLLLSIPSVVKAQEKVAVTSNSIAAVSNLCERFHLIVRQLRVSRKSHESLDIRDEYDVQYLFHALLHLHFNDIRSEEPTPSYAGGSARMDFLLRPEKLVVETKMSRRGLGAKELGDQLSEDIQRYKAHPDCKVLICFVYDPEELIANPRGIECDLSSSKEINVQVFIRP